MPTARIQAGKLRHVIQIMQTTLAQDASGNIKPSEQTQVTSVRASVESLTGRELYNAQQVVSEVTHKITMRYQAGIKAQQNVWFNDPGTGMPRQFQIQAVQNPTETRHMLYLLCIERDNSAREP
jgi:SPP1 family predicted phage head-tail adaptor